MPHWIRRGLDIARRARDVLSSVPDARTDEHVPPATAFDAVNDGFHTSYDALREQTSKERVVLVVLAEEIVLSRRGAVSRATLRDRRFDIAKSVAHAPIAIYASLHRVGPRELGDDSLDALRGLRKHVEGALEDLDEEVTEHAAEAMFDLGVTLGACSGFLAKVIASRTAPASALDAFAAELGGRLLRLADYATKIQLQVLDEVVERLIASLPPEDRAALTIVVTGDHQARERNLATQYFRSRTSRWRDGEERVLYAENVEDLEGALQLVGTQSLDAALAGAFFGDRTRLQRDVLGDAAKRQLAAAHFDPLDG